MEDRPTSGLEIRPLGETEVEPYRDIRLRMLREHPESFGASADDFEREADEVYRQRYRERTERESNFILGAFLDGALVGTAGIFRKSGPKEAHKAVLWGMYVAPEARGRGIGRSLVERAVALAAESMRGLEQVQLCVVTANEPACQLYETSGFQTYGLEREALKLDGRSLDERHMVRFLERPA